MGKISVTQGKLRENTGNFILARMWPPCLFYIQQEGIPVGSVPPARTPYVLQ